MFGRAWTCAAGGLPHSAAPHDRLMWIGDGMKEDLADGVLVDLSGLDIRGVLDEGESGLAGAFERVLVKQETCSGFSNSI